MLRIGLFLAGYFIVTTAAFPLAFRGHKWWSKHPQHALRSALVVLGGALGALAASAACLLWCLGLARDQLHHSSPNGPEVEALTVAVVLLTVLVFSVGAFRVELALSSMFDSRREVEMLLESRIRARISHREVEVAVIRADSALAFCAPGAPARVVVSDTLVERLNDGELDAVVCHELEHIRRRHGALKVLSEIVASWCPWLPASRSLRGTVAVLVELVADDRARREAGAAVTASALGKLDVGSCAGAGTQLRAARLLQ